MVYRCFQTNKPVGFCFFWPAVFFGCRARKGGGGWGDRGGVIISVFDFVPRVCHAGRDKER